MTLQLSTKKNKAENNAPTQKHAKNDCAAKGKITEQIQLENIFE